MRKKNNQTFQFQVVSPTCLFYLNSTGTLLPVAIQLFAKPDPENPVRQYLFHTTFSNTQKVGNNPREGLGYARGERVDAQPLEMVPAGADV